MNISNRLFQFFQQNRGMPFRAMTVFNFLLEAALFGSLLILLMLLVRRLFRKKAGNRLIYLLWLLVAIRLLVPLALPNPMMNELRPTFSEDLGARPVADQIRVRAHDTMLEWSRQLSERESEAGVDRTATYTPSRLLFDTAVYASYGWLGKWLFVAYATAAAGVLAYMIIQNVRFRRRLLKNRIAPLADEQLELYHALCEKRKVKPVPVWYVDPLPSACLVGVVKPYIALPLNLSESELPQVLTHELCHLKAGDPWWAALRNLCCIVHWFNPLVWIAARCVRTDCELACDERVTAGMEAQERLAYANTLVLAAARRNAPRMSVLATGMTMTGKRLKQRVSAIISSSKKWVWLAAVLGVVLVLITAMAFFTAEKHQDSSEVLMNKAMQRFSLDGRMAVVVPEGVQFASRSIATEEEALFYAQELLNTPYLGGISSAKEAFGPLRASSFEGEWRVEAPEADYGFELYVDSDGRLLYWNECFPLYSEEYPYEWELIKEPVEAYVRQFARDCLGNPAIREIRIDEQRYTMEERYIYGRAMDEQGRGLFSFVMDPFAYRLTGYMDLRHTTFGDGTCFSHAVWGLRNRLTETTDITPVDLAQGMITVEALDETTICSAFTIDADALSEAAYADLQNRYGTELVVYRYEYLTDRYGVASPYQNAEAYLRRNEGMITKEDAEKMACAAAAPVLGTEAGQVECSTVDAFPEAGWYEAYCSHTRDGVKLLVVVRVSIHDGEILKIEPVLGITELPEQTAEPSSVDVDQEQFVTLPPTLLPTNTPSPPFEYHGGDAVETVILAKDGREYVVEVQNVRLITEEYPGPGADDISMTEAGRIALEAVSREYGISWEELPNYKLHASFLTEDTVENTPKWWFNLVIRSTGECRYTIGVTSPQGEVEHLSGPGDGNG